MIDLHVHTINSDGRLKVEEILERGKRQGIKIDENLDIKTPNDKASTVLKYHSTGGEVFWAHPFDYKDIDHKKYIKDMYDLEILDGIECIHTRHSLEQIEYIKEFAKEKNLKISGGSDFHRDEKQKLGYGVEGTVPITEEYLLKNV